MKLEVLPENADFDSTKAYRIILSSDSYVMIKDGDGVVDRLGTKVSIFKDRN